MNTLVTPEWLKERLSNPKTVVLDATLPPVGVSPPPDVHARYLETHLPGAVYFDIEKYSDHSTKLPHMLPSPEAFAQMMAELGVGSDMDIVVYEQAGLFSAPRAWWMLRTYGAKNVFILDGGLKAWIDASLSTATGPVTREPAQFNPTFNASAVKNFAQVQQLIDQKALILDARPAGRFNGSAPEPRAGLSSGHMPGALNTPLGELTEDGKMKSPEKLKEYFAGKGVELDRSITTTCGSGVTAAAVLLGLELAGAQDVSLYDGSWAEYAQHPKAVIIK